MTAAAAAHPVTDTAPPDAPWLVMVHGASQDHRVFDAQVAAFRDAYRVLLLDLPGHGSSAGIAGPFGTVEYAAAVRAALTVAGITNCHYWGTHTGAVIGLWLACREAGLFRSLVLEGPFDPGQPIASVTTLFPEICAVAKRDGVAAAHDAWWRDGRWFDVMRDHPEVCRAAAQRAMIAGFGGAPWLYDGPPAAPVSSVMADLTDLTVPMLIVNGEHDLPDFLEAAGELDAALPDSRRVSIAGGGGFPLWEFPDAVNDAVADFLNDVA